MMGSIVMKNEHSSCQVEAHAPSWMEDAPGACSIVWRLHEQERLSNEFEHFLELNATVWGASSFQQNVLLFRRKTMFSTINVGQQLIQLFYFHSSVAANVWREELLLETSRSFPRETEEARKRKVYDESIVLVGMMGSGYLWRELQLRATLADSYSLFFSVFLKDIS